MAIPTQHAQKVRTPRVHPKISRSVLVAFIVIS
jgi:hypothetical protein